MAERKRNVKLSMLIRNLFQQADWIDRLMMVFGSLGAVGDGCYNAGVLLILTTAVNIVGSGSNSIANLNHTSPALLTRSVSSKFKPLSFMVVSAGGDLPPPPTDPVLDPAMLTLSVTSSPDPTMIPPSGI
ncbi:hypothetical protein SUGI_0766200 [Cryptomeria japonica]|nr:hypothetical protein SUGI_0766200 [Cryptomeria japonica]